MNAPDQEIALPLRTPLFRGERRLHVALVGLPKVGKTTFFQDAASAAVETARLGDASHEYRRCTVQVGLDEVELLDLPDIVTLDPVSGDDRAVLKYLLWGERGVSEPARVPDVIVHVVDATALERHLELTLELLLLGRPVVVALNRMDEAADKGIYLNIRALAQGLGVPVLPTVAHMGQGVRELLEAAVTAGREAASPVPVPASAHIGTALAPLSGWVRICGLSMALEVPTPFLVCRLAMGDADFVERLREQHPQCHAELGDVLEQAARPLPRPLEEELHADRHHRAATLAESATRVGMLSGERGWRHWADELFLHPRWGLLGSLAVFALVLFVVFEVSTWLDAMTAARLVDAVSGWQPQSLAGVIARAVTDGLIGLVGIVVPYMIPLVLLLVVLEESGVMQRIAFVVDRGFHRIGLHGGVAVPFLLGLGCNVPAIAAAARATRGHERVVASLLITFVPCSARSAIILALAGKYLGAGGVLAIFGLTIVVIAVVGQILTRRYAPPGPGQVQEIPPYALPHPGELLANTWARTRDVLTIVTPLLVGGSVILALMAYVGADAWINTLLTPVTHWWLGLPVVLGVPILFGVLRKELSLLMVYQALGTFEVGAVLDWVQLLSFLLFLTFYVPCVSTFAVMLRSVGRREAFISIGLSVGVALLVSGVARVLLETLRYLLP